MTYQYTDNKEQTAERLKRLLSYGWLIGDDFLEYANQFYPKTVEAYRQRQTACKALDDAMAEELPGD